MKNKTSLIGVIVGLIGVAAGLYSLYLPVMYIGHASFIVSVLLGAGLIIGLVSLRRQPKTLGIVAIVVPILFIILYFYYLIAYPFPLPFRGW